MPVVTGVCPWSETSAVVTLWTASSGAATTTLFSTAALAVCTWTYTRFNSTVADQWPSQSHREEKPEARQRAERLLRAALSAQQREELEKLGYFTVVGMRRYRIHRGRVRNVQEVDFAGRHIAMYCAHPAELMPDADTMLTQMLWLQYREEEFLSLANKS